MSPDPQARRQDPSLHDLIRGAVNHYSVGGASEIIARWEDTPRLERATLILEAITAIDRHLQAIDLHAENDQPVPISLGALVVLYLDVVRRLA